MKFKLISILYFFVLPIMVFGQKLPLDLNTFYVTIDTTSYKKLFENSFVKDTLFICRSETNSTNIETYSGKYLIGNSATIEFFIPMPTNNPGDTFGDIGIEFKTRKIGELQKYSTENTKIDSTYNLTDNIKIPWYKSLEIKNFNPHLEVSILEYQKQYLEYLGFTTEEINSSMTYAQYNSILAEGKKYPRKFNSIKSLELILNQNEFNKLKESITIFGGSIKGKKLYLNDCTINCAIKKGNNFKIKKLVLDLVDEVIAKEIKISENIILQTKNKEAILTFTY